MARRFERISGHNLPTEQARIPAGYVQVVLRNGQCLRCRLSFPDAQTALLITQRNGWFRRADQERRIPVADIEEVILDREATW